MESETEQGGKGGVSRSHYRQKTVVGIKKCKQFIRERELKMLRCSRRLRLFDGCGAL